MKDRQKHIVLTRFWVGDTVYHLADNAKGFILHVQFCTEHLVPQYFCVFDDRNGEWCQEMELSDEKVSAHVP